MVLYFSATGNTEYAAQELARQLGDECVNLLPRNYVANDAYPMLEKEPYRFGKYRYVVEESFK